ncbi:MAG: helix-turn-helix domain-containing protein [Candidatus Pacearchaeota archaeon]|nr:helix-turn-helix domain-containing protein [Candidatus Pacearchaeota archaeon]
MKNGLENNSIFTEVFGNNPVIKVLDFLITFADFDYPLTEIAKNSGVSYSTLQTFWHKLERNNIIVKTRRVGKSNLYKLNTQNPAVKQLIRLDWKLTIGSTPLKEITA